MGRLRLACAAAVRFTRQHGLRETLRLTARGAAALGLRGLLRRAAVDARVRDDNARYRAWLGSDLELPYGNSRSDPSQGPRISLITATFNADLVWLEHCARSVRAQTYANWEWCVCDDGSTRPEAVAAVQALAADHRVRVVRSAVNGGIVQATNAALALASGEFVGFLDHDDELAPHALARVAARLAAEPDLDIVYTDEDKIDGTGTRSEPHFKPDWSPELLRSCMYLSHFTVMRRALVQQLGGLRAGTDGAQDYDLALRAAGVTTRIGHVPDVLYHWRAATASGAASRLAKPWAVAAGRRVLEDDVQRRGAPALVQPTEAAGHYRIRRRGPRPRVEIIAPSQAAGVAAAHGPTADYLVLLEPGAVPANADWIDALLDVCLDPDVAVASGLVLAGRGRIDSAGLVLTASGPLHAFRGEPVWAHGHRSNLLDVRNCAAVDRTFLMTRRDVLERLGGIDASARPTTWSIDYALRARRAGLRVAVTPHARVRAPAGVDRAFAPGELDRLREVWGDWLSRDPYYNPHFDQQAASFRLPEAGTPPSVNP